MFEKVFTSYVENNHYIYRIGRVQSFPYHKPLPYFLDSSNGVGCGSVSWSSSGYNHACGNSDYYGSDLIAESLNVARAKFRDSCFSSASTGTSLVEFRQSLGMIESRAAQLIAALRALKKRDIHALHQALSLKTPSREQHKRFRKKANDVGGLWLEYWMGWAPLAGDIVNTIKVIGGDLPAGLCRGRASKTDSYEEVTQPFGAEIYTLRSKIKVRSQVVAEVFVSDENKALRNQLGLRPLSIAIEIIPWSWFVSWFSNYADYLTQFDSLSGFAFKNPCYTSVAVYSDYSHMAYPPAGTETLFCDTTGVVMRRHLGIPDVAFIGPSLPNRLSITRAATAISLLLQSFHKLK